MQEQQAGQPTPTPVRHGIRLDGIADLDAAVRAVQEHPGSVEILVGPGQLAGRHLGSVPRRQIGEALRAAGADPLIVHAESSLDEDAPDEGIIAVLDDDLALAAGLGADYVVVPRAGVRAGRRNSGRNGGRDEQRIFSMLAALAEAAAAHRVHLVLENEGATADEVDLLIGMEQARKDGTVDAGPQYLVSVAWNVASSTRAGEDPAEAFRRMLPLLDRTPLLVRGVDEASLRAVLEAVPDLREAVSAGRALVVLNPS